MQSDTFSKDARGTTLVPTATSYSSRSSAVGDDGDAGDAQGRIDTDWVPAGGRKVAGSNPVAPIARRIDGVPPRPRSRLRSIRSAVVESNAIAFRLLGPVEALANG